MRGVLEMCEGLSLFNLNLLAAGMNNYDEGLPEDME
jgi:hypothetical protein